jgi:UDP-3-O-acyl-N-acetylglucosamine deacetylase
VNIAQESHFSFVRQVEDFSGRGLRQGVSLGNIQCLVFGKINNGITLIPVDQDTRVACTKLVDAKKDLNLDEE